MKIFNKSGLEISDEIFNKLSIISKMNKEAERRKDSMGQPLSYSEQYFLRKKVFKSEDPYFFGGGSFHAPEMVFDPSEAINIKGDTLNFMSWDWTRDWDAVPRKRPPDSSIFGLKKAQIEENKPELNVTPSPVAQNPLDGKSNVQARRIVSKIVHEKSLGLFSDSYWEGPKRIFDAMNEDGLNWHITSTEYGVSKTMQETWTGEKWRIPNNYKDWKFEVNFTNDKGRPTTIYGILTAHGAAEIDDPLRKYDMTVIVG